MSPLRQSIAERFYSGSPRLRSALVNVYGWGQAKRRFGRAYRRHVAWLDRTQWWDPEEIREFQTARLRALLEAARRDVPYYGPVLDRAGIDPATAEVADLGRLPLLTKREIQRSASDLVTRDRLRRLRAVRQRSSGTTGEPLEFYLPRPVAYSLQYALLYRFYGWAGVERGDRRVTLGGRLVSTKPPYWVFNRAENQLLLSAQALNERTAGEYVEQVAAFAPRFIAGHPSAIGFLAAYVSDRGLKVPVRAVFTTGETLDPGQRERIEEAFGCEVFESYGMIETVASAFECEAHEGFHDAVELGVMELLPSDEEGIARIVGTTLWNDVMPFIRYETRDLAEPVADTRCSCGRGLPLRLRRVLGRRDDFLRAPSGTTVIPAGVRSVIRPHIQPLERYQVQQLDGSTFRVLIAAAGSDADEVEPRRASAIAEALGDVLGEDARIGVEAVERIEGGSLKARTVVNLTDARP